jgi:hypothetical protein
LVSSLNKKVTLFVPKKLVTVEAKGPLTERLDASNCFQRVAKTSRSTLKSREHTTVDATP